MDEEKKIYVKEMRLGVWLMDEAHEATGYLVIGEKRACVIDTMNGYFNLYEEVRKITDKPVFVINTHGHGDHFLGNIYFEETYLNPLDDELAKQFTESEEFIRYCEERGKEMPPFRPMNPGDVFDLGGRTLEIYALPGHTPGEVVVLLREDRILFSGDAINHHLWMQLDGCLPLHAYVKELDKVMFLKEKADIILHGHNRGEADDISLLRCMRNGIQEICDGKTQDDKPYQWFGATDLQHAYVCEAGKKYSQDDSVVCYRANNV